MFRFLRIERPTTATLRPVCDGDVDRLLHPVDVRGEGGDQDAALALRDDLAERLADEPLRAREPRPLRVRRVAEQEIDAAVADLGEPPDVGAEAVHRRVVELPVARVQHAAGVGLDQDRDVVRNGVRHAHELEAERAELERRPLRVDLAQLGRAEQAVLVQLRLDEAERQAGRPDLGDLDLPHQIRQPPDVVLVRMRQHDRAKPARAVPEIREVREDEVDAEVLVTRKRETGVDDEGAALVLEHGHVLSDLAEPAERDHAQRRGCHRPSVSAAGGHPRPARSPRSRGAGGRSPFMVTYCRENRARTCSCGPLPGTGCRYSRSSASSSP